VKLVTFRRAGEGLYAARAGVLLPYGLVDLHAAAPLVFEEWDERPLDMLRLLDDSEEGLGLDGANEITNAVLEQIGDAIDVVRDEDVSGSIRRSVDWRYVAAASAFRNQVARAFTTPPFIALVRYLRGSCHHSKT
jgi:hypothetical protein